MIPENVKQQLRKGENLEVEFVTDARNLDRIAKTVCAFLNTNGGFVFCGVNEKGKIIGVNDAESMAIKIQNYLHDHISPKVVYSVSVDDEDGMNMITIEVPFGKDRPYVFKGAVYFRHSSQTRAADSSALKKMIQTVSTEVERWERRKSVSLDRKDLVTDEIRETVREAIESHRFEFKKPKNIVSVLEELALSRAGIFTQATDVLFAKNPALRHPQARVRATCYPEDKASDEYIDDRIFEGPLVRVLSDVINFINLNTRQSTSFRENDIQHEIFTEYPDFAIREGLVNAFAHRDYSNFSGGISVSIYPTRLEIWNSGSLPMGLKPGDLKKNHPSLPTNPDITHVLYLRRLMNRIGRGTLKIMEECRKYGLSTPNWKDKSTGVILTLYSKTSEKNVFNKRQIALLDNTKEGNFVKPSVYREKYANNISERQARRDLDDLVNLGFLIRVGEGSASKFKRTNRTYNKRNRT